MSAFIDFLTNIFYITGIALLVLAIIAFYGYNQLRSLSEGIRECWSNIGVAGSKQISLINQLIDIVKGYQESEKFVMLKVSEDMSSAAHLTQLSQHSNMVLSAVGGMSQKFPELKANEQYNRLIENIQACEVQLESARQKYNASVKAYNITRSSIPHIFYASTLGFRGAPYLESDGDTPAMKAGELKSFVDSDDRERLNALLGQAGSKILQAGTKVIEGSKHLAEEAQEKIRKIQENRSSSAGKPNGEQSDHSETCSSCQLAVAKGSLFCNHCGFKLN